MSVGGVWKEGVFERLKIRKINSHDADSVDTIFKMLEVDRVYYAILNSSSVQKLDESDYSDKITVLANNVLGGLKLYYVVSNHSSCIVRFREIEKLYQECIANGEHIEIINDFY